MRRHAQVTLSSASVNIYKIFQKMVKLTSKYLIQKAVKKSHLNKTESDWEYLSKLTHLHLQSQFIDEIETVMDCLSVSVIYLQNNYLETIHGMQNFPKVTHLYLQRNKISRIDNLQNLKFLKKIYLGYNFISVFEGFENLPNLTEIHMESQRLPQGETLYFDPRSIRALAKTLKVLNIANNHVRSVRCLSGLFALETLIADNNQIGDLEDVIEVLAGLPNLKKLDLRNNPVTNDRKYRDAVICASKSLTELDDKEISRSSRIFVENFTASKESRMRLLSKKSTKDNFSFENFIKCATFSKPEDVLKSCSSGNLGSKLFPSWKKRNSDRNLRNKQTSNLGSYFLEEIMKCNPF